MAKPRANTLTGRRWQFGWCEFDEISRTVTVHKEPVRLEAKPLDVLTYLLERPSETVGKEELIEAIWGSTTDQSLTVAIAKLRKAFGGERDSIILNIAGVGYRMAVPVVCVLGQQPSPPSLSFKAGEPIPRRPEWKVVRRLGADAISPVWLAERESTGERRVFKFATDGIHLRALQREATVARLFEKAFGGPVSWAVRIYDRAFQEPPFFIGSEYAGVDLLEWSSSPDFKEMEMAARIRIAAEIADAVAAAHSVGVLHNDLKPGNLLMSRGETGEGTAGALWRVKVADFGVASLFDTEHLREMNITDYGLASGGHGETQSTPVGTAMYRAPELHAGSGPTMLGDVYSLGVLLYQMVIGDFKQQLSPGWEARVPDPVLREDIAKAAQVDPPQRLPSAANLAQRLHRIEERRREQARMLADAERTRQAEKALERARVRRPWMIAAFATLLAGLVVSLLLYRNVRAEKNIADERLARFEQMYGFVARDLLGQANPYIGVPGANLTGQTLVDAVRTAVPRIDQRFRQQPDVAGRLHIAIGDVFRIRLQHADAENEYKLAAERFRAAQGDLSPDAIVAELKRDDTYLVSLAPGAIKSATEDFSRQQTLLARVHNPSAELQAWAALVQASLTGLGSKPAEALPPLQEAIRKADNSPGFDPYLLVTLKKRICPIYLRMGDAENAERTARNLIVDMARLYGPDSSVLIPLDMYIQEALHLEGKYKEALAQANANVVQFSRIMSPQHETTLGALASRAAIEGQLGMYEAAAHDDLQVYNVELSLKQPSLRLELGSLADGALFECHSGHYQQGMEDARRMIQQASHAPAPMPTFVAHATFTLAECQIAQSEARPNGTAGLQQAEELLKVIDVNSREPGAELPADMRARIELAHARLALLRHDRETAAKLAAQAAPAFQGKDTDPYEKAALDHVQQAIATSRVTPPSVPASR